MGGAGIAVGPAGLGLLLRGNRPWPDLLSWSEAALGAGAARLWLSDEGAGLAKAAALSRRFPVLRIGLVVSLRRGALTVLGKALTSLDVVAGGRLDVAVEARPAEAAEAVLVLAALASGRPLHYTGVLVRAEGARCLPPSRQRPSFPLWRVEARGSGTVAGLGAPAGWDRSGHGWIRAAVVGGSL